MVNNDNYLKDRFLRAVVLGELGNLDWASFQLGGVVVTLKAFKLYFSDIKTQYVSSFMPAATFEPGQFTPSHTRFLFRVRKGAYLIHSDVLVAYMRLMLETGELGDAGDLGLKSAHFDNGDPSVNEVRFSYSV